MNSTPGVLAVLTDPALRDEADRVGAAVGARIVHAGMTFSAPARASQKTWTAAAAVLLDEQAAGDCAQRALPRRDHVVMIADTAPTAATLHAALAVGAQRVVTLPADGDALVRDLTAAADAARDDKRRGQVVAVTGGRGGAGASLFAAGLAANAGDAVLLDLDPCGGGIDLLVGGENAEGLRWPDLTVQGGRLDWPAVRAALPRHRAVSVLSGGRRSHRPNPEAVAAVIDAGRRGGATVVCDTPRCVVGAGETALETADLVVVVSPCDVRACAAAASRIPLLSGFNPNTGLVARGPSPGGLRAGEVAELVGLPLLASMRAEPRIAERLEYGRLRLPRRSALTAACRRVLALLAAGGRVGEDGAA